MHGAISACGRKAYQSCRFIRKTKNYNALSLSLNVASDIVPGPVASHRVAVARLASA
ncbi:hypothetical protein C4J93_1723 [Pseudomonas sp. R2-37-08W]|nr:hypothetical protein C4J93_1723 [Pseudomonas sp. R2-37-08W]